MKPNRLHGIFKSNQAATLGWVGIDSAYLAEIVGTSGFDAVLIDCQHGMPGHETMVCMLQALGIAMVQDGKSIQIAVNTMHAVDLMAGERMWDEEEEKRL